MKETLKILLVDDDAVDRMAVHRSLQRAGLHIHLVEAEDCQSTIATLHQDQFDCVFLDYRLPDGDGLFLVQQVRQMGLSVPLIVLTGQGDEQVAVELMKAGASDYFSKSRIAPEALSRSVLNAVRIHRAELQAAEATRLLRESEERYRLVLEGSNDGIWDWYICRNEIFCNDRLFELIGVPRAEFGTAYDAFYKLIHPEDRTRVLMAIMGHLERGENFDVEFRIRHASGEYCYCTARGKAQRDPQGNLFRMSGVLTDITARKRAEEEVVKLNRNLERRVAELQTLFDVIPIGIAIADDPKCQQIRINPTYTRMLGLPSNGAASMAIDPRQCTYKIHRNGRELAPEELPMEVAATQGTAILDTEMDVRREDGNTVNVLCCAAPLFDEQGKSRGCIAAFLDITERKRTEAAQQFLSQASSLLAGSLDTKTILQNLSRLVVPFLADFCCFDLVTSNLRLRRVAWHHREADKQAWFDQIQHYLPDPKSNNPIGCCLTNRETVFVPQVSEAWLQSAAVNSEHLQFLQGLEIGSLMAVPLTVHDQVLGMVTLGRTIASPQHYTSADLQLAEELAQRTALAVDNTQLYQVTQEAEHNLRHALLILGQHQQQLRTLQRLTDLLNQRLTNLPGLLRAIVDAMRDAIPNTEFALIVLQNPHTKLLELTTATGIRAEQLQLDTAFAPGEGLLGEIFLTGQSQLVRITTDARARGNRGLDDGPATDSSSELPASLGGVAIASPQAGKLGVLAIGNWRNSHAFDEEDMQLLSAFGEQAAIALTNAQLINALEEREAQLAIQNQVLGEQNRELERQRQQIQLQNLQLREAAQLKSQFIATMSHELRTPMTAVIGFSQLLLRQGQLTPQQRDMLGRILNNGRNLLALINDILDLSKIESGRLDLRLEEFNLAQLVVATTEELRSLADQKNLPLQVHVNLTNPLVVNDSTRLRQILANLLSNAIKFTESGGVCVTVEEMHDDLLALSVQDTGIGIAESDLASIFEEFRQLDQGLSKRFPGTGLGLAITDLLVQMMHGSISVQSKLNQGSTFRIEMPRRVES